MTTQDAANDPRNDPTIGIKLQWNVTCNLITKTCLNMVGKSYKQSVTNHPKVSLQCHNNMQQYVIIFAMKFDLDGQLN